MAGFFPSYVAEIASTGLDVDVTWNDWPVHQAAEAEMMKTSSVRLNAMTLESANVLRVLVKPLDPSLGIPKRPILEVRLFQMLSDQEQTTLFRHFYHPGLRPLDPEGWVEVARHEMLFTRTFGRYQWEDGPAFMPSDRGDVLAALVRLHNAIGRRDFDTFAKECAVKLEETTRATGRDRAMVGEEEVEKLKAFATLKDWALAPLDLEKIELTSSALGRLVTPSLGGLAALVVRTGEGGPAFPFPVTFGRVRGQWAVVR